MAEDKVIVLVSRPGCETYGNLMSPVCTEDANGLGVEVDRPPPVVGLGTRSEVGLMIGDDDLLAYVHPPGVQVDVGPLQSAA